MTQKGRVSPFGDPRIKGCSPLPAAFRSVPRPSSPLSAKASTKCPYALDPKLLRRTQGADPPRTASKPRLLLSTSCYPPGASAHGPMTPGITPRVRQPPPTASRIPLHNVKDQRTEDRIQRTEPLNANLVPIHVSREPLGPWWSRPGSNRRPPACKAGALPAELRPRSEDRGRRSEDRERKPDRRRLAGWPGAFCPLSSVFCPLDLVGQGRLELPTSRLSSARSNQLSY
jgi:hypothetical protein